MHVDGLSCFKSQAKIGCFQCRSFRSQNLRQKVIRTSCKRRFVNVLAANAPTDVKPLRFGVGSVKEIPIFPLSVVAFPTAQVPLNIFEAR